ncbi:MAG: ABC transporter permease [Myxococcales bacterium]|nr:ABC transporter permease [Myxococcales bacterium]
MSPAGRSLRRTLALSGKELRHIVRDPRTLYLALGMPVVMLFIFGYAVTFDLDRLPLGVLDADRSPESRELVRAFESSGVFQRAWDLSNAAEEAEGHFHRGRIQGALVISPGFGRELGAGREGQVQFLLDGTDGVTAAIALGYAGAIAKAYQLRLLSRLSLELAPPLDARVRLRYNPEARSTIFIVPGLIALILALMMVLLTSLSVAREWERGSLEQLFATPAKRLQILIGKLLPYVALGMLQVLLVLALGTLLFQVPVRGSLLWLLGTALVFISGCVGQGLLISVLTRNQQLATQVAAITALLPTVLLSGFIFPIENMPWPLQALSTIVPARYFISALRGIMLKGNGPAEIWPQLAALLTFALVMLAAANARFQRRLD